MISSIKDKNYKQCSISVMDNIADPGIRFDAQGICNYYYEYLKDEGRYTLKGEQAELKISEIANLLRSEGRGKRYDCIVGVSGGVDSTFLAWKAKELNLRALCVHFDNGWNSELAVKNIESIVSRCGFDLYTYVIDWPEFKDIQLSYFRAGVIDIEAITDIGIHDALAQVSKEFKVPYILSGNNVWTESVLPSAWINKNPNNLYQIHKRFGSIELKNYPAKFKNGVYRPVSTGYQSIPLLNYVAYNKEKAKTIISKELSWRDYGGKHYESVFTRFYQGYILPNKFKVDKRKAHLSNLVYSKQLTRTEAIEELAKPIYPNELLTIDRSFVLKKLGLSEDDFERYMLEEPVDHTFYGGEQVKGKPTLSTRARMKLGAIKKKLF